MYQSIKYTQQDSSNSNLNYAGFPDLNNPRFNAYLALHLFETKDI